MEGLRPALGRPERFCFRFCRGARISLSGLEGRSHQSIETREAQRKTGYSSAYDIACLYADLGDKDEAFRWLNIAYQERDIGLLRLKTVSGSIHYVLTHALRVWCAKLGFRIN